MQGGTRCLTCRIIASLEGDDQVVLLEWLGDPSKSGNMIRKGLGAYGYSVSVTAISRHRRECR